MAHVARRGELAGFSKEVGTDAGELIEQPCDTLVPAAVDRVITADNARRIKCRILAEGANGPTTPEADRILAERGGDLFVIPDILCNSGGVVVSYFEWVQGLQQLFWSEQEVTARLHQVLDRSFEQVTALAVHDGISMRDAAMAIGVQRGRKAKVTRGRLP